MSKRRPLAVHRLLCALRWPFVCAARAPPRQQGIRQIMLSLEWYESSTSERNVSSFGRPADAAKRRQHTRNKDAADTHRGADA